MHEVDMTRALLMTLTDWWEAQPNQPQVTRVHLQVGDFTCVEPVSLEFAFATAVQGTVFAGCELAIERVPFVAHCPRCEANYQPQIGEAYACPTCHLPLTEIVSGRELKIDRLECAESQHEESLCT